MAFNFKDENDVKLYLENIYMEYKFGCDKEKKGDACHLMGDYMESIKKDLVQAASYYKSNCDERNFPRSCAKYAGYKSIGRGCEKDLQEAYTYMKKSCHLDDPRGCVSAGAMTMRKDTLFEKDRAEQVKTGIEFLKKSCDKFDNVEGCYLLSGIYLGGLKGEIDEDLENAYKTSLKACELGNAYACANISQMYTRGKGIEKNPELAASFKARAIAIHKEHVEASNQIEFQQGIEK